MARLPGAFLLLGLTLAACQREQAWPELRERAGDRVIVRHADGQIFVLTERGNLARATAATLQEREQRLAEFLNDFARQLGFEGSTTTLQFEAAAPPTALSLETTALNTIHLEPLHRGAAVVDRPQSAAFSAATGELRAVLVHSVNFGVLPEPIAADTTSLERARMALVRQLGASDAPSQVRVRAAPVISAQHQRAGYLVEYRRRDESGAGLWVRALFDPRDGGVYMLQREERDDFPQRAGARQ